MNRRRIALAWISKWKISTAVVASPVEDPREPWNPADWNGDVTELQKCLQGLKKEIQMILRTVPEQRRLLRIDPTEADAEETPKERMQPLQMRGSKKAASNGISIPQRFQREARSNMSLR
ncbi:hypothetical protein PC118_g23156 [Phytophthora cactorum]|uniref:Uncharacterized protein n=1 Tax=Phytophthora cactorum TaxID=29920 RepID=A0A8T1AKU7_9STRA|nr:hypothetical protein PC112_g21852 [Phytophthora cactorum]KAG2883526.1 hypothetical protein PC115_g21575 [Phytophthora cactorum]KAG2891019.1 hypothetical protein PC117_g24341 [Phytophthora cactorum]KAG2959168.1 hypothetical protein PC118_g23156 [Phytophthora cactorum]